MHLPLVKMQVSDVQVVLVAIKLSLQISYWQFILTEQYRKC